MSRYVSVRYILLLVLSSSLIIYSGCGGGGGASFTATVGGAVKYEDKEYGLSGFTNSTSYYKAVRYAEIEIVDPSNDTVLATGSTDATGNYSITFSTNRSTVYVRVKAATAASDAPDVEIQNFSGSIYSVAGEDITVQSGGTTSHDITIPIVTPKGEAVGGAFNILDVFVIGGEFVESLEGAKPPLLKAFWEAGKTTYGTYYCTEVEADCPRGEGIYLWGGTGIGTGDTDEYDDDVLWHEYGHFAAVKFSRDDSPGGEHYLTDNDLDLRLSWSEGLGNFFTGAVKSWLETNNPSLLSTASGVSSSSYMDTLGTAFSIKLDIASPSASGANSSFFIYASNEVAVANVLWKVMEGSGSGMTGIWNVLSDYMPSLSHPVNLEAFWDGWLVMESPDENEKAVIDGFYNDREVYYSRDSFKTDEIADPSRKLSVGSQEEHTFYAGDGSLDTDVDYIAFDAASGNSYTIKTSNLRNGADTYIRLLDIDGSTNLTSNDNSSGRTYTNCGSACPFNDATTLASKVSFTAYTSGPFYVEVSVSPDRPDSAGRYGSYMLSIESP